LDAKIQVYTTTVSTINHNVRIGKVVFVPLLEKLRQNTTKELLHNLIPQLNETISFMEILIQSHGNNQINIVI